MRLTLFITISLLLIGKLDAQILAGSYAPPAGQNGSTAIHKDSSIIVGWATNAVITRGWQDITNTSLGKTTAGNNTSATEIAGLNGIVSLGDGGSAIITFNGLITDGPGADFAVFENSFDGLFLELAFVEVSSDGINYYRFDAISQTDTTVQVGSFGNVDATNLYNLAGKYKAQYGTPFDLIELDGINGLDINAISHIKIIDVVGSKNPLYASYDVNGRAVNDPFPTAFATGGFDLDGIGVINFVPTAVQEFSTETIVNSYPNPFNNTLYIDLINNATATYQLINLSGQEVKNGIINQQHTTLLVDELKEGIYFLRLVGEHSTQTLKIIKK